jgi:hypothetical protein
MWLSESWETATAEVKRYILSAIGGCQSPEAIPFVKARLSDPDLKLAAVASLAKLGDTSILPTCDQFIRSGTEVQFGTAIAALRELGTQEAQSILEAALKSAPGNKGRLLAAQALAFLGNCAGAYLLESQLFMVQELMRGSSENEANARVQLKHEFARIVLALIHLHNTNALLTLRRVIETQSGDDTLMHHLKGLTLQMLKLAPTTSFDDWKTAMERWIEEKLAAASEDLKNPTCA